MSANPKDKCRSACDLANAWKAGRLVIELNNPPKIPDKPARPKKPELVPPNQVKRRRLGSDAGRFALLHAIAHIEFNAIDLAADILARFAASHDLADNKRADFVSDWVLVCEDEARHYSMIANRLKDLGGNYGDLVAHDGLWQAAMATKHDLSARLVIAPMILEARGLDVTPMMIEKLKKVGDDKSAKCLQIIYEEEISHVAAGARWFSHICKRKNIKEAPYFKKLMTKYYKGVLKPPFNVEARTKAGLAPSFYQS